MKQITPSHDLQWVLDGLLQNYKFLPHRFLQVPYQGFTWYVIVGQLNDFAVAPNFVFTPRPIPVRDEICQSIQSLVRSRFANACVLNIAAGVFGDHHRHKLWEAVESAAAGRDYILREGLDVVLMIVATVGNKNVLK